MENNNPWEKKKKKNYSLGYGKMRARGDKGMKILHGEDKLTFQESWKGCIREPGQNQYNHTYQKCMEERDSDGGGWLPPKICP